MSFVYDPENPVPSQGGKLLMNYRENIGVPECTVIQPEIGERADVVSFISEKIEQDLKIRGRSRICLSVCSDAEDTSFTAKLCELREDGYALNICDGICTLRHRQSDSTILEYIPGEKVKLDFMLPPAGWTIKPGSKLRLDISSSNFPAFNRHPNTKKPWIMEDSPIKARQTICLDGDSWIELPEE